jgi:hypothetical protein
MVSLINCIHLRDTNNTSIRSLLASHKEFDLELFTKLLTKDENLTALFNSDIYNLEK